ncbi:MAG TPA: hypothetical protein ENK18_21130 [Deltaproteobacteria bacterium]|nr:hypothetical protein [Deltaproteobacteria bacterium]
MQDGRSKGSAPLRAPKGRARSGDAPPRSRLQELADKIGNEEISGRIRAGNAGRDEMLALIGARLKTAREAQLREISETRRGANWDEWRQMSDRHRPGLSPPEPTRWHAVARAYDLALSAIRRGDLTRGRELIARAEIVEDRAWRELTSLVEVRDLERGEAWDTSWLDAIVTQTPAAGACGEPPELRALIDDIIETKTTMPLIPNRGRSRDPWWTEEEEEEDDGDPGDPG